jgi:PAS domain S-box-containing protein
VAHRLLFRGPEAFLSSSHAAAGRPEVETASPNDADARRFEAIVESSDDAIISKDLNGTITSWNPAAERLFGYTADEIVGQSIAKLMPIDRHDDMEAILGRIRRGERVEHFETVRISKDGRRIPVSLSVSPIKDSRGRVIGAAKIARDVSARRDAEVERERLLRDAQQGVRLRDVFLSVAGHELRTPLHALRLLLYNLGRSLTTDRQRSLAGRAEREIERLSELTDRLLDVARMASGGFTIEPGPMELSRLIHAVAGRMNEQAARSDSSIAVDAPEPVAGVWDERALDQAVTNLISNAIQFGRGGEIRVSLESTPELARVRVRDHGPGVRAEDRERIFGRFERGASDAASGGLGLGLWIAREILAAHGGRIGVADADGGGAEFVFELPVRTGGALASPAR